MVFLMYENSVKGVNSYIIILINLEELIRQGINARKKFLVEFEISNLNQNYLLVIEKLIAIHNR